MISISTLLDWFGRQKDLRCILFAGIAAAVFGAAVAPRFAFGEPLSGPDRKILESILAANDNVVSGAVAGEMDVRSVERYAGNVYVLDAHVTWDGSRALYEYRLQKDSGTPGSEFNRTGRLLDTPAVIVDHHQSTKKAFRAIDRCKTYDGVFRVTPAENWLSYNLEFPLREVLTADETWDYGPRVASVKRKGSTVTFSLHTPGKKGGFEATFSTEHDGLIQNVVHTDASGERYRAEYGWAKSADVWYPKSLRMFSRVTGRDFLHPRFDMSISNFVPRSQIPARVFAEDRLGIDEMTEVVTYRKGTAPVVRKAKQVAPSDQLNQLGRTLSDSGFAAEQR
jgi:hypothetical protein